MSHARRPGNRRVDVALAVAVAVATSVLLATDAAGEGPHHPAVYLFPALLGLLMLGRRRWPLGTALATFGSLGAYYMLELPALGLAVPAAGALYSLAEAGRLRVAAWLVGTSLAVSTTARLLEGGERASFVLGYELVTALTLMAATVALGDAVRSRRGWQAEIARREREAAAEREREAIRRVEDERLRISRELHDVLAHTMSVVAIQADVAAEALDDARAATSVTAATTGMAGDGLPAPSGTGTAGDGRRAGAGTGVAGTGGEAADRALAAVGAALGAIREASRQAMGELRATVRLLRTPATRGPLSPVAGLADVDRVVRAARDSGLAVTVEVEGEPRPLPVVVDAAAHRIVQESITNVLRHARATRAEVVVAHEPGAVAITVVDDGRGAGRNRNGYGYGLQGMAERAGLLGGTFRAGRSEQGGFVVEARLPLSPGGAGPGPGREGR